MKLIRYDLDESEMCQDTTGRYVEYSDVEPIIKERDEARAEIERLKAIGDKLKQARGCDSADLDWVVADTIEEIEMWVDNTAKLNKENADLRLQLSAHK